VKTAALFGAAVVPLLLDAVASVRVGGSEALSRAQKTAWLLVVWLAPLIGAILAMQVSRERSVPAPVPGSLEEGPSAGIVMQTGGGVGGPSGDGGSAGPFVS
jgi:phospholipase D-like protein